MIDWVMPDWNRVTLLALLIVGCYQQIVAEKKRDDDLFLIRYGWFEDTVELLRTINKIRREYDECLEGQKMGPEQKAYFEETPFLIQNQMQRHFAKGILIFKGKKMLEMFGNFSKGTEILHSGEQDWFIKWCDFYQELLNYKGLFLGLGPEMNLNKNTVGEDIIEYFNMEI